MEHDDSSRYRRRSPPDRENADPDECRRSLEQSFYAFETVEHQPETDGYRVEVEGGIDEPVVAISTVVGAVAGTDPEELDPLHAAVDADALDELLNGPPANGDVRVEFQFEGYDVRLDGGGSLTVEPHQSK